jgi:hypothetical protein
MVRGILFSPVIVHLILSSVCGQEDRKPNKAFLIGVEKYQADGLSLRYVDNDLKLLNKALSTYCGFETRDVHNTVVNSWEVTGDARVSHRESLMAELQRWASQMQESDTAILYFSGHGFIGPDGKLYLALIDVNPTVPSAGSLAASWLREVLEKCPAGKKLLLLDACHSAGAKSAIDGTAAAKDIIRVFEDTQGVVTFASCSEDQRSYLWPKKRYSLFTYWLAKGLAGQADQDIDGIVTLSELERFVRPNVKLAAKVDLEEDQTPQLLGSRDVIRDIKVSPCALSWDDLLFEMVDCIDTTVRLRNLTCIGVCDVTCGDSARSLGLDHGMLPSSAAIMLCRRLIDKAEDRYTVFSPDVMRDVLQDANAQAGQLGIVSVRGLDVNGISIDAIVDGTVLSRQEALVGLRANLLNCMINSERPTTQYVTTGGFAYLSRNEWSDLGISVDFTTTTDAADHPSERPATDDPIGVSAPDTPTPLVPPSAQAAVRAFEELQAVTLQRRHPLDPQAVFECSFSVGLETRDSAGRFTPREMDFVDGKCIVKFKRGDVYRIRLQNHHPDSRGVFARVLVDGLNTLPEPIRAKGITVSLRQAAGREIQVAPPVILREARPWFVHAGFDGCISGFLDGNWEIEKGHHEFRVVDAAESVAARTKYTDNIGLITLAFYEFDPARSDSSPHVPGGSAFGRFVDREYDRYAGNGVPGKELAVIHIHYVMK